MPTTSDLKMYDCLPDVEDDLSVLNSLVDKMKNRGTFHLAGETGDFIKRKAAWAPAEVDDNGFKDRFGHRGVVERCIALALALEVPVGFLAEVASREMSSHDASALIHNAYDEVVHFKAFKAAAKGYRVDHDLLCEAFDICKDLEGISSRVPAVKLAGSLELGVFFPTLSMLRSFGNAALKLMVQSVSRDEVCHVQTNWYITDTYYSANESAEFKRFRHGLIDWLTSGLTNPKFGPDYWMRQSDKLMANRAAPELDWTSQGMYLAPFEVSNKNIDSYAS